MKWTIEQKLDRYGFLSNTDSNIGQNKIPIIDELATLKTSIMNKTISMDDNCRTFDNDCFQILFSCICWTSQNREKLSKTWQLFCLHFGGKKDSIFHLNYNVLKKLQKLLILTSNISRWNCLALLRADKMYHFNTLDWHWLLLSS